MAAGVAASPLGRALGVPVDRAGRIAVEPDLSLAGHQEVFIVGDLAAVSSDGKPVPGLAAAAKQEGKHAAHNVMRAIAGEPTKDFRYTDLGTLATVGRGAAVADFPAFASRESPHGCSGCWSISSIWWASAIVFW